MGIRQLIAAAGAAAILAGAPAAFAQVNGPPPPAGPDPAAPVHAVGQAYLDRLAKLPDMNGVWLFTQPNKKVHVAIFDPTQAVVPDLFVAKRKDGWGIEINAATLPEGWTKFTAVVARA